MVWDIERGVASGGETVPWQTDTCIGDWHYDRSVFEQHRYKTAETRSCRCSIDIVSKNGNLLLSVPVRGDGTHRRGRSERASRASASGWT